MRALFSNYSDELARRATITIETGAAETGYGVDVLTDDNPAKVFRGTSGSISLQIAFSVRTPIDILALIHCTAETDEDVRLMADDAADWGSPALDVPIPIAGWLGSGLTRWPLNSWLDVVGLEDYDSSGYLNYLLAFGRTTPLAQNLQLGQIRLQPEMRSFYIDRDLTERPGKKIIKNTTAFDVDTIYSRGTTRWSEQFGLGGFEATERTAFRAHWYDVAGQTYPWLFVPDPDVNECYLVRWDSDDYQLQRATTAQARVPVAVREVSRGLRPGV